MNRPLFFGVAGAVIIVIAFILYLITRRAEQAGDYSKSPLVYAAIITGALGALLVIVGALSI